MEMTFRWYGNDDPVTLQNIKQIPGMRGIVTAIYDVPVGQVWSRERIRQLKSDVELAKEAIKSGAEFLVSPHYDEEIQKVALESGIEYFPGCATTTEIVKAMNGGANIIKLFPGGVLGPSFIKDIHGPIPTVQLMPSGGVSLANIKEWKDKGAVAVGVGSALSAKVGSEGYESVTEIAKKFVSALEG